MTENIEFHLSGQFQGEKNPKAAPSPEIKRWFKEAGSHAGCLLADGLAPQKQEVHVNYAHVEVNEVVILSVVKLVNYKESILGQTRKVIQRASGVS